MNNITFIIPVRIDSHYRLRNLTSVLNFFLNSAQNTKFIITEGDVSTKIETIPASERVCKLFRHDDNPIFHRTKYVNDVLRTLDDEIVAVWDCDAIGSFDNISQAADMLSQTEDVMAYPYNGIFWSVGEYHSELFSKSLDLRVLTDFPQPRALMCGYHSVGGAFLVNVKRYKKYGWENEYFKGWGPEDAERYARLEILGKKPVRVDAELFHLYHTRGINSGTSDHGLAMSTKKEYAHVCGMTSEELKEYISTWNWIK